MVEERQHHIQLCVAQLRRLTSAVTQPDGPKSEDSGLTPRSQPEFPKFNERRVEELLSQVRTDLVEDYCGMFLSMSTYVIRHVQSSSSYVTCLRQQPE